VKSDSECVALVGKNEVTAPPIKKHK